VEVKMSRKSALLSEELAESAKLELRKMGGNALVARKLEAIIAACSYGITEVAKIYDVTPKTLAFWIKNYTKSRFGLSQWLLEHALWQPLPGRQ
jgi:hypothetical protein